jgi:hypothetical protein
MTYSSAFATRGEFPSLVPGSIPPTSRAIFSHEADFNFTWGFHADFDLTVLIPVVTISMRLVGSISGGITI